MFNTIFFSSEAQSQSGDLFFQTHSPGSNKIGQIISNYIKKPYLTLCWGSGVEWGVTSCSINFATKKSLFFDICVQHGRKRSYDVVVLLHFKTIQDCLPAKATRKHHKKWDKVNGGEDRYLRYLQHSS